MNSTAKTFVNTLASFQERISTAKPTIRKKLNNLIHFVQISSLRDDDGTTKRLSFSLCEEDKKTYGCFFLSFFFFCPKRSEACGRYNYYFDADNESYNPINRSVCFEKIFFFGSAPIRIKWMRTRDKNQMIFRIFDKNHRSSRGRRPPKNVFFLLQILLSLQMMMTLSSFIHHHFQSSIVGVFAQNRRCTTLYS